MNAMFQDLLRDMVEHTDGCLGALVMGFDGITVDQYLRAGAALDVETVGMEYSVILKEIRRAAEQLSAGEAREVSIRADSVTTVIRLLNENYFVALALEARGNAGKARFLLRTKTADMLASLE